MDSNPENWKRDETPKSFFNPLDKEIEIPYKNDNNDDHIYKMPPLKIATQPKFMADLLIKHIVDEVINYRDIGVVTPQIRAAITKEVEA